MKSHIVVLLIILALAKLGLCVDDKRKSRLSNYYEKGNYHKVCLIYEDIKNTALTTEELLEVGNSYYFLEDFANSVKTFQRVLKKSGYSSLKREDIFSYVNSIFLKEDYNLLKKIEKELPADIKEDYPVSNIFSSLRFIEKSNTGAHYSIIRDTIIKGLDCNYGLSKLGDCMQYYSHNSPDIYNDIVEERADKYQAETIKAVKELYQPKLNLLSCSFSNRNSIPGELYRQIQSKFGNKFVAFISLSEDGKRFIYTDFSSGKRTSLYEAEIINEKIKEKGRLPFCDNTADYGMPVYMPGKNRIMFVSDRKGGFGGWDLYSAKINDKGEWEEPINMGPLINSPGNELFPNVDNKNILYFSSNGRPGYGQYDIYRVDLSSADIKVENLHKPINSSSNEMSYIVFNDYKVGVSLRSFRDSLGEENALVSMVELTEPELSDKVNASLPQVVLSEEKPEEIIHTNIEVDSKLYSGELYYMFDSYKVDTKNCIEALEACLKGVSNGKAKSDLGNSMNSSKSIELSGYTDCSGSELYNLWLANKRINVVKHQIIEECCVEEKYITLFVYGELKPRGDSRLSRKVNLNVVRSQRSDYNLLIAKRINSLAELNNVAERYSLNRDLLLELNPEIKGEEDLKGKIIFVPVNQIIRVKIGDCISILAEKYGVSQSSLVRANNLKESSLIIENQILIIPIKKI